MIEHETNTKIETTAKGGGEGEAVGSGGKEPSNQKVIQNYLRKVEKNLKGFSREAKDSILIEIEGHIREKIREGGAGKDGGEDHVNRILNDFGDPEEVAHDYNPVVRLNKGKIILFQLYSIFITLFLVPFILFEILDEPASLWEPSQDSLIIWAGVIIISLSVFFNIVHMKQPVGYLRYSYLTIFTNGILGLYFLFYIFEWFFGYLDSTVHPKSQIFEILLNEDTEGYALLRFGIFIVLGVPSFHMSYLGYSIMTKDTADGIAPLQNISYKLLPIILVVNTFLLYYVFSEMNDTFRYFSEWNSDVSYVVLILLVFLTVSIASTIIIREISGIKTIHIQREVYILMAVSLILTYAIAGGVIIGNIQLSDNWENGYYSLGADESKEFKDLSNGLFNNGSMYTWDLQAMEDNYVLTLHRWDRYLTKIIETNSILIDIDPGEYDGFHYKSVQSSGYYIHLVIQCRPKHLEEDEQRRLDHYYLLMTFESSAAKVTKFLFDDSFRDYLNNLVVEQYNASIIFHNKFIENESRKTSENEVTPGTHEYDLLNITMFSFSNGDFIEANLSTASIPLLDIDTWDLGFPVIEYYPGPGSISVLFLFISKIDAHIEQDTYSNHNKFTYFTKLSTNGTILIQPMLLTHGRYIAPESYDLYGNKSTYTILYCYDDVFLIKNFETGKEEEVWSDIFLKITMNDTSGDYELLQCDISIEQDESFFSFFDLAYKDNSGFIHFYELEIPINNSGKTITLNKYLFNMRGDVQKDTVFQLAEISFFSDLENRYDDFNDLIFFAFTEGFFADGNVTYLFLRVGVSDILTSKPTRSQSGQIILIIEGDNLSYYDFGYEIQSKETKDVLFIAMISGFTCGAAIPTYFLYLLRKRAK